MEISTGLGKSYLGKVVWGKDVWGKVVWGKVEDDIYEYEPACVIFTLFSISIHSPILNLKIPKFSFLQIYVKGKPIVQTIDMNWKMFI